MLEQYKHKDLTIKELAKITPYKDIEPILKKMHGRVYKSTFAQYKKIFDSIQEMEWTGKVNKEERIKCWCPMDFFEETLDQYYSIATNKYSMSFRPWAEMANMKVENIVLDYVLKEQILACFLYEITYYGYEEEQMKAEGDKLQEIVKGIKSGEHKTIPADDLLTK